MHRQAHVNKQNEFSQAFFLWRYKGIKCVFTKNDESHLIFVGVWLCSGETWEI